MYVFAGHHSQWECSPQDTVTLKGVNADWAEAHQCAHVRTHSLQRAQTVLFSADDSVLLQPFVPPSPPSMPFFLWLSLRAHFSRIISSPAPYC